MEAVIVGMAVAAAALFLSRKMLRDLGIGKKKDCGCGKCNE
ncbi:FeoB-associated Cys-rich membrane protein [bacterium]|nr:MAG: FeoB-associated Cys-rich membrane protein [bacterium]